MLSKLPQELKDEIYYYALVDVGHGLVPRAGLQPSPGLRYRYNAKPKLWMATTTKKYRKNLGRTEPYIGLFPDVDIALPTSNDHFAFGLFLTAKQISAEARRVFYSRNHFIFEDRFTLEKFIANVGQNSMHVRSVSVNLYQKCSGKHTKAMYHEHREWFLLHRNKPCRPKLLDSVTKLRGACPQLRYLELALIPPGTLNKDDTRDIGTKHFLQWRWIMELASWGGIKFSILTPSDNYISTLLPVEILPTRNRKTLYLQIMEYLNRPRLRRRGTRQTKVQPAGDLGLEVIDGSGG
ncbi:hypothetical protein DL95DRAFT_396858 [Leptodontidium sp. 2 PMI_412]|nr:hypothetical protein DL95DRAFT_396858 [Leptodontidium sp. 2 PMI_412]